MTARQFVLKEPAAIFFIQSLRYNYGHYTMVIIREAKNYNPEFVCIGCTGCKAKSHRQVKSEFIALLPRIEARAEAGAVFAFSEFDCQPGIGMPR
jgi:hypothetical protein